MRGLALVVLVLILALLLGVGVVSAQDLPEGGDPPQALTPTGSPTPIPTATVVPEPTATATPGASTGNVPKSGSIGDSKQGVSAGGQATDSSALQSQTSGEADTSVQKNKDVSGSSVGNATDNLADKAETWDIPGPWDWVVIVALLVLAALAFGLAYLAFKQSKKPRTPDTAERKEVPAPPSVSLPGSASAPSAPPGDPLEEAVRGWKRRLRQP